MTRRNTRSAPTQPKIEPKAAVAGARKTKTKTRAATTSRTAPEPAPIQSLSVTAPKAPSGKLATLLDRIGQPAGATIGELGDATGWQARTIRAAFSRLRQRGFPIILVTGADGRKAYRLERKGLDLPLGHRGGDHRDPLVWTPLLRPRRRGQDGGPEQGAPSCDG